MLFSPVIYLALFSPTAFGEQPVCEESETATTYSRTSLKEIILEPDVWQEGSVFVRGKIFFAPLSGAFSLRDGIWSLPLDASGCENMNIFNDGSALVSVFGTVRFENDEPTLVIDDFFETVPSATRTVFNAGVYGLIGLAVLPIALFIDRRKRKKGLDPESEKAQKQKAWGPIFFGLLGSGAWLGNPVIGACACIYGLMMGKKFLHSPYRRRALFGMIVCAIGLLGLSVVTASGRQTSHYGPDFFTAFEESMGP